MAAKGSCIDFLFLAPPTRLLVPLLGSSTCIFHYLYMMDFTDSPLITAPTDLMVPSVVTKLMTYIGLARNMEPSDTTYYSISIATHVSFRNGKKGVECLTTMTSFLSVKFSGKQVVNFQRTKYHGNIVELEVLCATTFSCF